jgi:hypothetical protein
MNQSENDREHESVAQTLARYSAQVDMLNETIETYENLMGRAVRLLMHQRSGQTANEIGAEMEAAIDVSTEQLEKFGG